MSKAIKEIRKGQIIYILKDGEIFEETVVEREKITGDYFVVKTKKFRLCFGYFESIVEKNTFTKYTTYTFYFNFHTYISFFYNCLSQL